MVDDRPCFLYYVDVLMMNTMGGGVHFLQVDFSGVCFKQVGLPGHIGVRFLHVIHQLYLFDYNVPFYMRHEISIFVGQKT